MAFESPLISKLGAVNTMLNTMGEPSVNSLASAALDAQIAVNVLDEVSVAVQGSGWHWNTEFHTLMPNNNGEIIIPANTARVDTIGNSKWVDVIARGLRLYDRQKNTYTFTAPLELEIVVVLNWDELPLAAKRYITMRAARIFQQRQQDPNNPAQPASIEEQRALFELKDAELKTQDSNMLRDSASVVAILARGNF
jgi:hypothetical protein